MLKKTKYGLALGGFLLGLSCLAPTAYGQQDPLTLNPQNLVALKTFIFSGARITLSTHGNVVEFESPAGFEHIAIGDIHEGYILCASGTNQFDVGDSELGFNAPLTATCPNNTSCTVTRNTSNGLMQLTQTFTLIASERALKIEMIVKNLSPSLPLTGVILRRQVDFDIDSVFNNSHAAPARDGVFAWNNAASVPQGHGLMLRYVRGGTREAKVNSFETSCSPPDSAQAGPVSGDFTETIQFQLGNIAPLGSKSVVVQYQQSM